MDPPYKLQPTSKAGGRLTEILQSEIGFPDLCVLYKRTKPDKNNFETMSVGNNINFYQAVMHENQVKCCSE